MKNKDSSRNPPRCGCTDQNGRLKKCYYSEREAREQMQYRMEMSNGSVILEVYQCPESEHWYHLTKR